MMIVSANDPIASIREKSASKLMYFVRTRHRESKAWLASRQDKDESEDETTRAMSLTMAEYILPYAVHLVAHIPTFADRPMSDYYMSEGFKVEKSSVVWLRRRIQREGFRQRLWQRMLPAAGIPWGIPLWRRRIGCRH